MFLVFFCFLFIECYAFSFLMYLRFEFASSIPDVIIVLLTTAQYSLNCVFASSISELSNVLYMIYAWLSLRHVRIISLNLWFLSASSSILDIVFNVRMMSF